MKRTVWMKQVGVCLVAVLMLGGVARADPIGTASVLQFVDMFAFNTDEVEQQSYRTTDEIGFRADYFDPNPACAGVAPVLHDLFLFTAEGLFLLQTSASTGPGFGGPKYRGVFKSFVTAASIPLAPGSYTATFLVRDCLNTNSIVRVPFLSFRVVAP